MSARADVDLEQLLHALEPLLRRIVREEVNEAIKNAPNLFYLNTKTDLYQDMQDILQRKMTQDIKLYTHAEVWSE